MALAYLFDPNNQFQDRNGVNNVAGFLRVYYEGTDDRANTYKDFNGTLNHADIPIDNDGRAVVIVDDEKTYRLEVYARNGNLLWTQHPLSALVGGEAYTGDVSDATSSFTKDDGDTSEMSSGSTLKVIFTKISKFFASLKTVAFTGSYNDLEDTPTIPAAQVQSDWNESDNTKADYIKNKPSIPDDANLVHKSGAETITGVKTFNNDVSPRQTGTIFSKQSKIFICSVIKPYAEWSAAEQDDNHFRSWTLDITSIVTVASTHCNIIVKLMGSWYSSSGNGALQKEITCQIFNGNIVILKEDYTISQSPCADEFVISGVVKLGNDYLLHVINRNPTANNYPLRLEIEVFNKNYSVLDNVTLTESITEGLPAWATDVPQVTANGSPVLTEATAATVAMTGNYNDLSNKPTVPEMFHKAFTINPLTQQELTATDITNGYVDIELSLGATIATGLGYTVWTIGLPNSDYSGWKLAQMYDRIEVYTHGENLQLLAVRYDDLDADDYGNTLDGADTDNVWNRTFTGNGTRLQEIDAFVVRCYLKSDFGWSAGSKAPIKIWFTSIG